MVASVVIMLHLVTSSYIPWVVPLPRMPGESESPKHVIILVVTITGQGDNPIYTFFVFQATWVHIGYMYCRVKGKDTHFAKIFSALQNWIHHVNEKPCSF